MRQSSTDIVSILHSDMIIGPCYFENMLAHLKPGKVVCATRIEPPIHPAGKEKIVKDFGDEANTFKWDMFESFCNEERLSRFGETTKGIFAPWMLYKEDHLAIGGHDQGFAPYGYEDSDIFNRWILAGYEMIQARDSLCYHMTCRGHRWNKGVGIENADYQETMDNGRRHFLKKWGHWIKNDEYQYPIISPVYKKKIIINNSNPNFDFLNDWFNGGNDIIVEIDCNTFTQQDFQYITQLNDIIADSGEIGVFNLGNVSITINKIQDYSKDLISM
jgi:predicted glycosyltransferase involved in capsule biosynthesis